MFTMENVQETTIALWNGMTDYSYDLPCQINRGGSLWVKI